jgi:hypothetical protein
MSVVGHSRAKKPRRGWLGLLASGVFGVVLFLLGRLSAPEALAEKRPNDAQASDQPIQSSPRSQRGFRARDVPKLAAPATPEVCTPTTDQNRKDTATSVVDNLLRRVGDFGQNPRFPTAEARANQLRPFVHGLAEGIRQTRPDLFKALTEDFNDRLCKEGMSDDKTILLSNLATDLPEIVDGKGFDCFFTGAKGKEDVPLWSMLDAWRASGLEKTAALAQVEATASDKRTIRRLVTHEEEMAARSAGGENSRVVVPGAMGNLLPTPSPTGEELSPPAPSRN